MRLLLDTHIWLWLFQDPKHLGRYAVQELHNQENELWLSPISTWEALTLHGKGKIEIAEELGPWVSRMTAGTREAPLTHEIALASRQLQMHRDPADRIIVATAKVLDLTLVTSDQKLLGLADIKTLANR